MKKQILVDKLSIERHLFDLTNRWHVLFGFLAACAGLFLFSYAIRVNVVVALFLLCVVLYLAFLKKEHKLSYNFLHLSFLFVLVIAASYGVITNSKIVANDLQWLLLPFSLVSMLSVLLFNDLIITFLLTVTCAVTVAHFTADPRTILLLFLISGLVAPVAVWGARRRNTITKAGVIIGLVQAFAFFLLSHLSLEDPHRYLYLGINGLLTGIVVLGVLPVFEHLFGTITNIKLLELADFNNPILNRLMLEAPGTYHHSLIVGNLAEAGCKAVGANALLARIGAYYHDIGKLAKPEYFTENQGITGNVHETLAPNMSKLVIMNHVNEGLELAKRSNLSPRLVDFIQQHHGKSLVYFFYRRALENSETQEEITEEGFRYPGPKPNTKETAMVLLADSVEAATRTLKDPTASQIEETVHKIINNKFIDGQLDECDLTLKDMEVIATVFVHILSGMYHSRINYPEAGSENNHTKPANEDPRRPPEGTQSRS